MRVNTPSLATASIKPEFIDARFHADFLATSNVVRHPKRIIFERNGMGMLRCA